MHTIFVARDFSRTPGPRFARLGPHSGEEFRARLLHALQQTGDECVRVVLDGTEGYGSSFLEEAFGGLVRTGKISPSDIIRRIEIIANTSLYQSYAEEAKRYLREAVSAGKR